MDVISILSIIIIAGVAIERLMKHVKKSKCMGGEIHFDTSASAPDLTGLIGRKPI